MKDTKKTVCYQNEYMDLMKKYREEGLTYPKTVIDEFATIAFLEDCGEDNDNVTNCSPSELPEGYTTRKN